MKIENKKKTLILFLTIIISYCIFGTVSILHRKAKIDEFRNHIPVLEGMYEEGYIDYILGDEYKAANTPLPYLAPHLISKILSSKPDIYIARGINFIVSILTTILFILIIKKIIGQTDFSILIFFFYPYFLKTSFVFYLALYGTFFLLLSILLLSKQNKWNILISGFSISAGILSQQFIAALVPSYIIWKWQSNYSKRFIEFGLFLIPLTIPISLFLVWGGLTHPSWKFHGPQLDFTHITASFVIVGGTFLPFTIDKIKSLRLFPSITILLVSLILVSFFSPQHDEFGWQGQVTGYTYNFITKIYSVSSILSLLFQIILCFSGLYIFYALSGNLKNSTDKLFFISSILLIIEFFFDTVYSERHLLPLISLLFLLAIPRIRQNWILNLWIIFQVIFGSIYFYYWMFIHPDFG